MFKDIEKRIKILANVLFWVVTLGCVVLAFLLGWDRSYRYAEFLPGNFFGFLIGGPIDAYILSGLIYLAADAAENIKTTRDMTKEILNTTSTRREKQLTVTQEAEKERKREDRINQYWSEHADEKQALLQKRNEAKMKQEHLSVLATEERAALQAVIDKIDFELGKDR